MKIKTLLLPIIALAIMVALGACSNEELIPAPIPQEEGRTLLLTASMPGEDVATRVGLTQEDDKSITLTWEADDELKLVFVQGDDTKVKVTNTAKVASMSADKKKATFKIQTPKEIDLSKVFDLYGVYGAGIIDITGTNPIVTLPLHLGTETSLDDVQNRKDVMLSFSNTNIDITQGNISTAFTHLGSLFCITIKNTHTESFGLLYSASLNGVDNLDNQNWAYNTAQTGAQSYDLVKNEFQNPTSAGNKISFRKSETTLLAGHTTTFWGWNPPLPTVKWPKLQLKLSARIHSDQDILYSANYLPARTSATAAGKSYYFYVAWDGAELNFTNESFTNELTIDVADMGTLSNLLSATQKANTTKLTLTGQINKADYDVMKLQMPSLAHVDLSQATSYEGDILNKIPDFAFGSYDPTNQEDPFLNSNQIIQTVILPQNATVIGAKAFSGCAGITSALTIPENVTTIGDRAFIGSSFNGSLTIPNKVITIEAMAFSSSDFDRLIFQDGSSLKTIGTMAFTGCENMIGELNLPASLVTIGNLAFTGNGFNKLTFQDGSKLATISGSAFMACANLTGQLNLPDSLVTIGDAAFYGCQFSGSLTIPNNVTTIGKTAFSGSKFTGPLIIPKEVITIGDYAFIECGFTGALSFQDESKLETIGVQAFIKCGFNGALALPANLQTIGDKSFENCNGFNGMITFPSTLTSIGVYGFDGCSNVTAFQFPHTTPIAYTTSMLAAGKTVEVQAAAVDTYKATDVWKNHPIVPMFDEFAINVATNGTMSTLLTPLQKANIRKLTVTGEINKADYDVMKNDMPNLKVVDLSQVTSYEGETVNKIPDSAFGDYDLNPGNRTITTIVLPESITAIGNYAFRNCYRLTGSLTIPDNVTTIGNFAFSMCKFTGDLVLPEGLITIQNSTFDNSGFNGSLTIPASVVSIGERAFSDCKFTGDLILPEGLTTIENAAFNRCDKITGTVVFSSKLTSIGTFGFNGCTGIEAFQFPHTTPIEYTENMLTEGTKVKVPAKAVATYKAIGAWHLRHPIVGYMGVEVEVPSM